MELYNYTEYSVHNPESRTVYIENIQNTIVMMLSDVFSVLHMRCTCQVLKSHWIPYIMNSVKSFKTRLLWDKENNDSIYELLDLKRI